MRTDQQHEQLWQILLLDPTPRRFADFYEATWTQLFVYCKEILHDPDDTEEVLQATYVMLWEMLNASAQVPETLLSAKQGRTQYAASVPMACPLPPTAVSALLKCANLELDRQRKRYRREYSRRVSLGNAGPLADCGTSPQDRIMRMQNIQMLNAVLHQMAPRVRAALEMHFFEGRSKTEIADLLHVDRSRVSRQIDRAVRQLRRELFG